MRSREAAPSDRRRSSAGFTLLEALIAVVVLALMLGALLPSFGAGVRHAASLDDALRARLLAQSILSEATQGRRLPDGVTRGSFDIFAWDLTVAPLRTESIGDLGHEQWGLRRLDVRVSWPPRHQVVLTTARVMAKGAGPAR